MYRRKLKKKKTTNGGPFGPPPPPKKLQIICSIESTFGINNHYYLSFNSITKHFLLTCFHGNMPALSVASLATFLDFRFFNFDQISAKLNLANKRKLKLKLHNLYLICINYAKWRHLVNNKRCLIYLSDYSYQKFRGHS